MVSNNPTSFEPTPPRRTDTCESQESQQSSRMSTFSSQASMTSMRSSTEASFFGAITARIRGRSQSRGRDQSRHPYAMELVPANNQAQRTFSSTSRQGATSAQKSKPSQQNPSRRSTHGSDPWRGRHSNDWLFNGYSVTATAKDLIKRNKS